MAKQTVAGLRVLEPPDGWEWVKRPTLKTIGSLHRVGSFGENEAPRALKALAKWAAEHSVGLTGTEYTRVGYRNGGYESYVYNKFSAKANVPASTIKAQWGEFKCPDCGSRKSTGTLFCISCMYACRCPQCGVAGQRIQQLPQNSDEAAARKRRPQFSGCGACFKVCTTSGCSNLVSPQSKGTKCRACEPTHMCNSCNGDFAYKDTVTVGKDAAGKDNRWACKPCHEKWSCPECKRYEVGQELHTKGGKKLCLVCLDATEDEERKKDEVFPATELPVGGSLKIPTLPERPFRTVSIEAELNGDGAYLARALYRCGLIERPIVEGYHQNANTESDFPAFLKYDGTVTAGELITFLLNLDDKEHADVLLKIMQKVRGMEKNKKVSIGPECGGHIHIDAHGYTYSDGWRLSTIFGYLEDPIFRLAGAGHKEGHRTLDPNHKRRAANHQEGGWAKPIDKGPWGVQSTWGRRIEQQGRGHALNFKPFFQARANCTCGEMTYNTGKNCRCNLGKATIEWRVWNSTNNPRILHAWISFMQALHAFAQQSTEMTEAEEKLYPALSWEQVEWLHVTAPFQAKQKERLEWIFKSLPLTDGERDSLVYALKQSDFKNFGDAYLNGLLKIPNGFALDAKKPARNPNRRKRKMNTKMPEPGSIPVDAPFDARRAVRRYTAMGYTLRQAESMARADMLAQRQPARTRR